MRYLLILFSLIHVQALSQVNSYSLVVQPSSSLVINGKTTVSKYTCSILKYTGSDTLQITGERGKGATFTSGDVKLVATEFDCGIQIITNDFQKTIDSKKYPDIIIHFISFAQEPTFQVTEEKFKGKLKLSLAGKSKSVEIKCAIKKVEDNVFHLIGKKDFTFADFGLKPPSKMLGMVKVKEAITVNFHLILKKV
jgi:hypothetical protein